MRSISLFSLLKCQILIGLCFFQIYTWSSPKYIRHLLQGETSFVLKDSLRSVDKCMYWVSCFCIWKPSSFPFEVQWYLAMCFLQGWVSELLFELCWHSTVHILRQSIIFCFSDCPLWITQSAYSRIYLFIQYYKISTGIIHRMSLADISLSLIAVHDVRYYHIITLDSTCFRMIMCEKMKEIEVICTLFAILIPKNFVYYYMHSCVISRTSNT